MKQKADRLRVFMGRLLTYALTVTSAVVAGAALLIAQIQGDQDVTGPVVFLIFGSFIFAVLAAWTWTLGEDR